MVVRLNHTIVAAHDKQASALFLTEILGISPPSRLGHFVGVRVGETTLDYADAGGEITSQHYAFLVSETEFDEIFRRIRERGITYWADPFKRKRDQINSWDDGRGVYFDDPNGHVLEILTRPYGSGGTTASNPHPLVSPKLEPDNSGDADRAGKGGGELSGAERPKAHISGG